MRPRQVLPLRQQRQLHHPYRSYLQPYEPDVPMSQTQPQDDLPLAQPGTIEPSKRDLQTLVDAQGIGTDAKRTRVGDGTPS